MVIGDVLPGSERLHKVRPERKRQPAQSSRHQTTHRPKLTAPRDARHAQAERTSFDLIRRGLRYRTAAKPDAGSATPAEERAYSAVSLICAITWSRTAANS